MVVLNSLVQELQGERHDRGLLLEGADIPCLLSSLLFKDPADVALRHVQSLSHEDFQEGGGRCLPKDRELAEEE